MGAKDIVISRVLAPHALDPQVQFPVPLLFFLKKDGFCHLGFFVQIQKRTASFNLFIYIITPEFQMLN